MTFEIREKKLSAIEIIQKSNSSKSAKAGHTLEGYGNLVA